MIVTHSINPLVIASKISCMGKIKVENGGIITNEFGDNSIVALWGPLITSNFRRIIYGIYKESCLLVFGWECSANHLAIDIGTKEIYILNFEQKTINDTFSITKIECDLMDDHDILLKTLEYGLLKVDLSQIQYNFFMGENDVL